MFGKKAATLFETSDTEQFLIPEGKQVDTVEVINGPGFEYVQVTLKDEPTAPVVTLASIQVTREPARPVGF
jgi:hypothetical protein